MTITNTFTTNTPITAAVGPQAIEKRYDATEAQLEVWLSSMQGDEANCAYNEIASLGFDGEIDLARMKSAIEKVVLRHGSLRSTFSEDGQQVIVRPEARFDFKVVDFRSKSEQEAVDAKREVVINEASTPFDIVNGPLLRVVVQQLPNSNYKLTFAAHHLVLDGWSLALFCQDLGHFYAELGGVTRDALPPANHYDQYSKAMEAYFDSADGKADEKFWVDQFADQIPVLDLPAEKKRPPMRTWFAHRYDHQLSTDLVERVRKVGAKSGCSLFNTMLAAFNAWVARISGNDDFCIGIPTAGQAAMDHPELIGHCVNTMPLRTKVNIENSFNDYMKECRSTLLDSFDHQRYSYGTLLRKLAPPRDPSRPPMLNVSFNIDPTVDCSELGFGDMDVEMLVEPRTFENVEWFINGVINKDKSIEMQVQFNTDLHSVQSMKGLFEGFETFLEEIAKDPTARIADMHLMSFAQRQKVLVDWNATEMEYPVDSTLHAEFSRQAEVTPEKTAVKFEDQSLTYAQVESKSSQIARYLQDQGVAPGDLVGICVNRSANMLVYLYGILKAGAGYVPLDPGYPADRLQYMCDHSGLKLIVTESELASQVAEFGKTQIEIDAAAEDIRKLDTDAPHNPAKAEDVCYVIYTSGSTGKPKGVQVPHGAVVNFLYAMKECPGFGEDENVLAVTTLSFDIAVLELYLPTIFGGKVVVLDSMTAADGVKLSTEIKRHNISLLQATPATWRMLIEAGWDGKRDMKVLCGGEPMPKDLVSPLLDRCAELWNMYGPTETTVWSAAFRITDAEAPILIGRPIGNTQIFILDANGNEVPAGCEGEVFIGGAGVTLGYRNQQEMTDSRFTRNRYRNPFASYVSDRIYKTGDLARYCNDGNIEFLRRNDKQVKVRGFRIELGEIEENLGSHDSVGQCVAVVREDNPGDTRLVAYIVPQSGQSVSATAIRDHLRASLPHYMVPQHFVELESFPQTNNGKIDYKALPLPGKESTDNSDDDAAMPQTAGEKYLAGVWQEILEVDEVYLNDTFFDVGGHSLLVMKVIASVNETTGVKLGPQEFLVSTLEQMADKVSQSYVFEEPATDLPAFEVPEKNETPNESVSATTSVPEKTEPKKSGAFRILKNFWS
jgi:amino acid adenylation domain-containing protein